MLDKCSHCEFEFENNHPWEHPGLCCDCYDLSWGYPLKDINLWRADKGKPPITKEWPSK